MKIVADDKIPFLKGVLEPYAEVIYLPGHEIDRAILKNADALLTRTRTRCNRDLLEGTGVRFIGTATIGYDHIDTAWCESNGIHWTNSPGCNSSSVCQYVTASLFRIAIHEELELKGKTLGIIGVGNVGTKVEKAARLLGMNVLLNDPPRERREGTAGYMTLTNLLAASDLVTVHVPLNIDGADKTWHMFGNEAFRQMKPGSWLINSSRGEVADTSALKNALAKGTIKGAVLDVWENEPHIDTGLMLQTLISTPHIAGYSTDGKANGTSMVVNSLAAFFGLPISEWYPPVLPSPSDSEFLIDCTGKTDEEIVRQAVLHTYNVLDDNARLRQSPSDFEKLRGSYPLRREYGAYRVMLKNPTGNAESILENLGFNLGSCVNS